MFVPNGGSTAVYHDGVFYFRDVEGLLGVLKSTGEFTWDVYDKPEALIDTGCSYGHLVPCGGQLLSVFIGKLGKWVKVFRLDFSNMEWVEVKSLGDDYSFLSSSSSFAAVTSDQPAGMGGRIYLPRLRGQTGIIYYSLKSGKYRSEPIERDEPMEDFYGTREPLNSFWIETR